jgi:hypothetical protein
MEEHCQNPLCQNKAVKEVPVSVEKPSDQVRALCATCGEPYTWGVQHGTMLCEGLKIDPPPEDWGDEPLFRVVYISRATARKSICPKTMTIRMRMKARSTMKRPLNTSRTRDTKSSSALWRAACGTAGVWMPA